jgi:hypothetical protein
MDPLYTFTGRKRTWPGIFCVIDGFFALLAYSAVGLWVFAAVALPHYVTNIRVNGHYSSSFIILIIMHIIYSLFTFFAQI